MNETIGIHLGIMSDLFNNGKHAVFIDADNVRLNYLLRVVRHCQRKFNHPKFLVVKSSLQSWHLVGLKLYRFVEVIEIVKKYLEFGIEHPGHYHFSLRKGYFVLRLDKKVWDVQPMFIIGGGSLSQEELDILNMYFLMLDKVRRFCLRWVENEVGNSFD